MATTALTTAAPSSAAITQLTFDAPKGGNSPWMSDRGRGFVAELSSAPSDALLLEELYREPSFSTLNTHFDDKQPNVGKVTLFLWIIEGLVVLTSLIVIPLCACGFLQSEGGSGSLIAFVAADALLIFCAVGHMLCLLSQVGTRSGMMSCLKDYAVEAYEWIFQTLTVYVSYTSRDIVRGLGPNPPQAKKLQLEQEQNQTLDELGYLRGNVSDWEERYGAYAGLSNMISMYLLLPMVVLAFAIAVVTCAALVSCACWRSRQDTKSGSLLDRPQTLPGLLLLGATLLLLHMAVGLPMLTYLLPLSVLSETYVCSPYRDSDYRVLDDATERLWSNETRVDPYCRLSPGVVMDKCRVKGRKTATEVICRDILESLRRPCFRKSCHRSVSRL
ncbi:hypothetical protein HPB47_009823 [Ixodes persulcatus]|uniref:Uncharacterized protein n=1 Tax=Ixodes persulcatus TaxID=34615 RepID=A0AC60P149_IXOPE|nr:hypothetical protein HPB47_009823 [Ixodes persulcatus]